MFEGVGERDLIHLRQIMMTHLMLFAVAQI